MLQAMTPCHELPAVGLSCHQLAYWNPKSKSIPAKSCMAAVQSCCWSVARPAGAQQGSNTDLRDCPHCHRTTSRETLRGCSCTLLLTVLQCRSCGAAIVAQGTSRLRMNNEGVKW